MHSKRIRPSEIYIETLEMFESNSLSFDDQQLLLDALQRLSDFIHFFDNLTDQDRQNKYDNYLVGLHEGKIPVDVMQASILVYQYKRYGFDTSLLELQTDIFGSRTAEFRCYKVPKFDQRFYKREIKKVLKRHRNLN